MEKPTPIPADPPIADGPIRLGYEPADAAEREETIDRMFAELPSGVLCLLIAIACGVVFVVGAVSVVGQVHKADVAATLVALPLLLFFGAGAASLGIVAWNDLVARPMRVMRRRRAGRPDAVGPGDEE